jgi:ribosome recycling factor
MPSLKEARARMEAALEAVQREFATVRTGKATPALLDTVKVEAYGAKMPLNQVASVNTPEPSLIVVQPFDKTLIADIERAIQTSDLGFNPANDGNIIRVPVPPLNEERRREYVKILHKMAEEGKVSIRHARHTARDEIQQRIKDHELGEDDGHRELDEVEKMTHEFTDKIDALMKSKETEVMAI